MKLLKRISIIGAVLLIMLTIAYQYLYKEHRDIALEEASFTIEASKLSNEFKEDGLNATHKYLNNVVIVKGVLTEIEDSGIALNDNVYVQFSGTDFSNLKLNSEIVVKGRFIGYDELLECVKLDQCTIIKI
ncbi:MAG: hypothetical protein WC389_02515 [Lutibacter sp.]|jgi:hypothetical protein